MAKLIVNPTSASRREILLESTSLSIGRDPSNDLVLPDSMVSRRHAVIEIRGSQYFLRDCNSSNGSLLNGDRVTERGLKDGDLMAIGATRLLFREATTAETPTLDKAGPPSSAPGIVCTQCKAPARDGDQFCRGCGAALMAAVSPKMLCPSCGTVVTLPARFCSVCGKELQRPGGMLERTTAQAALDADPMSLDATPAAPSVSAPPAVGSATVGPPPLPEVARSPQREPTLDPSPPSSQRAGTASPSPRPGAGPHVVPAPPFARPRALPRPPGAVVRLLAALLDTALVMLGQAALLAPVAYYWWAMWDATQPASLTYVALSLLVALVAMVLGALYYVYFWGVHGATPGKQAFGLAVAGTQGEMPIGIGRASLRLLGYAVSGAILGIGFLLVPLSGSGLHDRIAGTRVVYREKD